MLTVRTTKRLRWGYCHCCPLKDYHRLKAAIDWSGESDQLIYLWQNETIGQFTGIVVVSVGQDYVLVRHLSITPSDRAGKNVFALLAALQERYPQNGLWEP